MWSALSWIYPRLNYIEKTKTGDTFKEKLTDPELKKALIDILECEEDVD